MAVVLADACDPAVLAGAPDAVVLEDARGPAVLALVPLAVEIAPVHLPVLMSVCRAHTRGAPLGTVPKEIPDDDDYDEYLVGFIHKTADGQTLSAQDKRGSLSIFPTIVSSIYY